MEFLSLALPLYFFVFLSKSPFDGEYINWLDDKNKKYSWCAFGHSPRLHWLPSEIHKHCFMESSQLLNSKWKMIFVGSCLIRDETANAGSTQEYRIFQQNYWNNNHKTTSLLIVLAMHLSFKWEKLLMLRRRTPIFQTIWIALIISLKILLSLLQKDYFCFCCTTYATIQTVSSGELFVLNHTDNFFLVSFWKSVQRENIRDSDR